MDCGGGYVKLFDCSLDAKDMHGESPYQIMFGNFLWLIFYSSPNLLIRHQIFYE